MTDTLLHLPFADEGYDDNAPDCRADVCDFSPVVAALHAYERATGQPGMPLSGWEVEAPAVTPPAGLLRRLGAIRAQPHRYTYSRDFAAARARAAACFNQGMRVGGEQIGASQIAILQNSSQGLLLALMALRERGIRRVVIAAPVYYAAVAACRHLALAVTLVPAADFVTGALDIPRLAREVRQPGSALVLTNPAYSVGVEYGAAQLGALFAMLPGDAPVLLDETRLGLHWSNDAPWYAMDFPPQTLILRSPSKVFLLNGVKVSFLIAPAALIRQVERASEALLGSVPGNSEAIALAYIAAWERWLGELRARRVGPMRAWKRALVATQRANLAAWQPVVARWGATVAPIDSGPYALVALPQPAPPLSSYAYAREHGILLMTADYFFHHHPAWQGFRLNTLVEYPTPLRRTIG